MIEQVKKAMIQSKFTFDDKDINAALVALNSR